MCIRFPPDQNYGCTNGSTKIKYSTCTGMIVVGLVYTAWAVIKCMGNVKIEGSHESLSSDFGCGVREHGRERRHGRFLEEEL